jgi:two-component system, LytTR family, response regulator
MRTLIIDDERLAREELRLLLASHSQIEIIGEADSVPTARRMIESEQPDLIFLDIDLRGSSGFDLLAELSPPLPLVIFSTAYDAFALRAFETNALDYLLKPVHPERLSTAIHRLPAPTPATCERLTPDSRVFVRDGERCWFVPVRDIHRIDSEGNYSRLHFAGGQALLLRSLNILESRLPASQFIRANRSQIINCEAIASIEPWFSQTLKITLNTGDEIEFSRRASLHFREKMGL